jgi:hypothetical protein
MLVVESVVGWSGCRLVGDWCRAAGWADADRCVETELFSSATPVSGRRRSSWGLFRDGHRGWRPRRRRQRRCWWCRGDCDRTGGCQPVMLAVQVAGAGPIRPAVGAAGVGGGGGHDGEGGSGGGASAVSGPGGLILVAVAVVVAARPRVVSGVCCERRWCRCGRGRRRGGTAAGTGVAAAGRGGAGGAWSALVV